MERITQESQKREVVDLCSDGIDIEARQILSQILFTNEGGHSEGGKNEKINIQDVRCLWHIIRFRGLDVSFCGSSRKEAD